MRSHPAHAHIRQPSDVHSTDGTATTTTLLLLLLLPDTPVPRHALTRQHGWPLCRHAGVIGTAAYSAPELLNAETPDADDRQLSAEDEQRILKADVSDAGWSGRIVGLVAARTQGPLLVCMVMLPQKVPPFVFLGPLTCCCAACRMPM